MKQQRRFQIKPIEAITGVSIAIGIMMLLSVIGAILINKNIVPEKNNIHIAIIIHFISVCISSFTIKLIYGSDNILRTVIIPCIYFMVLLVIHLTLKTDYRNVFATLISSIGGAMPAVITDLSRKKGKKRGYKYRFR